MCNFPSEGSCNLFRGSHRVPALLRVQSGAAALGSVCPEALEDMGNLNFDQPLRTALETMHSWLMYLEMEKESGRKLHIRLRKRMRSDKIQINYSQKTQSSQIRVYCSRLLYWQRQQNQSVSQKTNKQTKPLN